MKRVVLAAALLGATALPAFAGITCNMTDQRGNPLTYSFGRGGDGIAPEIAVSRNGTILGTGGPSWTRVSDKAQESNTLWQDEWSIAYPWDASKGVSVLRHNNNIVARGACIADYAVDTPAPASPPAPSYAPPPAAVYAPPPQAASNQVFIPLNSASSARSQAVNVTVGSIPVSMLIDSGCNSMALSPALADQLIAQGEAPSPGRSISRLPPASITPDAGCLSARCNW